MPGFDSFIESGIFMPFPTILERVASLFWTGFLHRIVFAQRPSEISSAILMAEPNNQTTMKITHLPLLALILSVLLLGGCCGFVKCDCYQSGLYISYFDSTGQCLNLSNQALVIETYSVAGNDLLEGEEFQRNGLDQGCTVYLYPQIDQYYVIRSDSMRFSDTLRVKELVDTDRKRGCCNCGPRILSIEYEIDGESFSEMDASRIY